MVRVIVVRKVIIIKENKCNIFISDDWFSFFSVPHWTPDSPVFNYLPYKNLVFHRTQLFIMHFFVSWVPSVGMGGSFMLETTSNLS